MVFSDDSVENLPKKIRAATGLIISTILYARDFFKEESYRPYDLGTSKVRILSKMSGSENVLKIINSIQGCFVAIEKKYLKTLVMEIFEKIGGTLWTDSPVEAYELNYYYDGGESISQASFDRFLKDLLRNISRMNTLSKQRKYYVSFKLFYNDTTPREFEPPGFIPYRSINQESTYAQFDLVDIAEIMAEPFSLNIKTSNSISSISSKFSSSFQNKRIENLHNPDESLI